MRAVSLISLHVSLLLSSFFAAPATLGPESFSKIFLRGTQHYPERAYQYATSSEGLDGSMEPLAIIYPQPGIAIAEIKRAVAYAKEHNVAIAVRTGGHQYSGASSTSGNNIQLDMSEAFLDFALTEATGVIRLGVSWSLRDMIGKLKALKMFVPTGVCSHVHVGGHAHSGGWGMLGRSFGLFSDHIEAIEVITADGKLRKASRDAPAGSDDADLFYGVIGGSPGNFGVLTHIHLKPHQDDACPRCGGVTHNGSVGINVVLAYDKKVLTVLLARLAAMNDDDDPDDERQRRTNDERRTTTTATTTRVTNDDDLTVIVLGPLLLSRLGRTIPFKLDGRSREQHGSRLVALSKWSRRSR
jgi:hypothetical protein